MSTLSWLGGLIVIVAGVVVPLALVAYRHRSSLRSSALAFRRD